MPQNRLIKQGVVSTILVAGSLMAAPLASAQLNTGEPQLVSTGQIITPLAPNGARFQPLNPNLADDPGFTAGQAVTTAVSPDGKTLLVLTSGYNSQNFTSGANAGSTNPADSNEYVFVFDISAGNPVQKQVLLVPNTYSGIAFNPSGQQFYVSGGMNDNVHIYGLAASVWAEATASPVALGHLASANPALGNFGGLGLITPPMASSLAVSKDGQTIVVANYENDSISILTLTNSGWAKSGELDLRPGVANPAATGTPGGSFPYWVSIVGNSTAYVTSIRDREVDVVNISGTPAVIARIPVPGSPNRSILSQDQSTLYVAQDNSDLVAVIGTASNKVLGEIKAGVPAGPSFFEPHHHGYTGATPNSLALSPDGKTLYVTDAGLNAVAVIALGHDWDDSHVTGLIPTGFYPNSVSTSADGKLLYIVNGKSANGPNPQYCHGGVPNGEGLTPNCGATNQYDWQLTKAGFQVVPVPSNHELSRLTQKVLENDHFTRALSAEHDRKMDELHKRIQHVIYIIRENRTYDQVLGDLAVGNGDPDLTQFGEAITPNIHAVASNFVDFDNFYDTSEVSGDGWPWSTSARSNDTIEKEIPVNYAGRGGDNNAEGTNRNINVGIGSFAARTAADPLGALAGNTQGGAPNLVPGTGDVAAPDDSEGNVGEGYIWNAANAAGLTVRDYGMFIDLARYNLAAFPTLNIPEDPTPFADNLQVAYSTSPFLAPVTDIYFRGFDNSYPDYYRFQEWNREFQQFDANGGLPALSLVRLMHDHTGNFDTAINGINTPELQVADNDYAVGLLIQAVANSKRYSGNTLIFVIEDDSQDGGDHVDAHRSVGFIVGPYVKQGHVDSRFHNTIDMVRTIEDVLGTPHLNLNDANALPMADAFDLDQKKWTFTAMPSALLSTTTLPIPASAFTSRGVATGSLKPLHDAKWWADATKGMDFSVEDHLDAAKYNRILWAGTMGDKPYPAMRSGQDLRANRTQLLRAFRERQAVQAPVPASTQNQVTEPAATGSSK